jgi:hypothetical protein
MPEWVYFVVGAVAPLAWALYQYFKPRVLSQVRYQISSCELPNFQIASVNMIIRGDPNPRFQICKDLIGSKIEVRSIGGKAASGLLIHMHLSHSIAHYDIHTDAEYKTRKGESDIQVIVPQLNPTGVIIVHAYCRKEEVKITEKVLIDHRVSLDEGKSQRVEHW